MVECHVAVLAVTRKRKLLVDGVSDFPNSHSTIKVDESSLTSQGFRPPLESVSVLETLEKRCNVNYRVRKI